MLAVGSGWIVTGDEQSVLGVLTLFGFIGWLVWTLAVAITMIRSDEAGHVDHERAVPVAG